MNNMTFEIGFEHEGNQFKGLVHPSNELDGDGKPASFKVILNSVSFGMLTFRDCKWSTEEPLPDSIIKATGKAIEKHYKL